MSWISIAIGTHVAAGALWTLISIGIAVTRRAPRVLLAVQIVAASVAVIAGITLWHALHSGAFGPVERLLVVGTVCAFVAFGLQLGVVVPALFEAANTRLVGGALVLWRVSAVLLVLAASAMVGSLDA